MSSTKCLAALAVACLLAVAAAAPASAQNIANPNGTPFGGGNLTPLTFAFGGGAGVVVTCNVVNIVGNPVPARGVQPNAIGGVSTRMARFLPMINGCNATVGGGGPFPATVVANCDWAYAVETWNGGTGASTERLQIGLGCANPLNAVTINVPAPGCTVNVHQQPLIHNGGPIAINGQNVPWPPPSTGIRINNNVNNTLTRTAIGACGGIGNPFPLGTLNGAFQLNNVWAGP